MSGGVSVAKTHIYGNTQYLFPTWMKEMKGNQAARALREGVVKKISQHTHSSNRKTKEFLLPYFQTMFRIDTYFACKMVPALNLSEQEIKFLLGPTHQHKIKDIMQCSQKTDEKQEEIQQTETKKTKKEPQKKETSDMKQPSIFDF
jgi:hypothetical protein